MAARVIPKEKEDAPMHATKFLKEEHGKAKAAFQEIEAAPAAQRGALWAKLRPELELHEKMEETHLYGPVAREVQVDRTFADWESAHRHEVQEAEGLIREIGGLDSADPAVAGDGEEAARRARAAHPQGGAGDLAEDRAGLERGAARGSGASDGRHEARGGGRRALTSAPESVRRRAAERPEAAG